MDHPLHIPCPHCDALNRLPAARLAEGPRCGQCRQPLFFGAPVEVDAERFARHLARSDLPLLVDVWASWCGPCRAMAPEFAAAARLLEPRVRLLKISTEEAPDLAQRFGIRSIPTLLLLHRGREVARSSGVMPARRIAAWAEEVLAAA
ncbi:MAG: thioredoxin TrxC [Rhodovarius sp.]|nr:thioredoxin TrxC [Rhodovarius sp.]